MTGAATEMRLIGGYVSRTVPSSWGVLDYLLNDLLRGASDFEYPAPAPRWDFPPAHLHLAQTESQLS